MLKPQGIIFLVGCLCSFSGSVSTSEPVKPSHPLETEQAKPYSIKVAMMPSSDAQKEIYREFLTRFESHSKDVEVHISVYEQDAISRLEKPQPADDVFFGFGEQVLSTLIDEGLLLDLTHLWREGGWSHRYIESARSVVERNDKIYALPLNYQHWGMYYRRSIFEHYNLTAPTTWQSMIDACQILAKNQLALFTLDHDSPSSVAAWFGYLSLRINGLEAHRNLVAGKVSFTSAQVKRIFDHWRQAMDAGCFGDATTLIPSVTRNQALPLLFDKQAAAVLMGNGFLVSVPESVRNDLVFTPFPNINPDIAVFETASMDVIVVSTSAQKNPAVQRLLSYISESDALINMNQSLSKLSPVQYDIQYHNRFLQAGDRLLKEAEGLAQLFDRAIKPEMAKPAMELMVMFQKQELTADEVMHTLEMYRKKLYKD